MFTADDERAIQSLAVSAGVAITNAQRYEAARTRQQWLRAAGALTRRMLSGDPVDHLQLIIDSCRQITGANLVAILVLDQNAGEFCVTHADGQHAGALIGVGVPVDDLCGQVLETGTPQRRDRPAASTRLAWATNAVATGPEMMAPLAQGDRVEGVLCVAKRRGAPSFTVEDLEMLASFVQQIFLVNELAGSRLALHRKAMLDERDQIASDLQATTIHRLYATGLSLHGLAGRLPPGPANHLRAQVTGLDAAISALRTSVFALQEDRGRIPTGLRGRVVATVEGAASDLGLEPSLRFCDSTIDHTPPALANELISTLGEIVRIVAEQRGARSLSVIVAGSLNCLRLIVIDDGPGGAAEVATSHLSDRAQPRRPHLGRFSVGDHTPSGRCFTWSVSLVSPHASR